MAVHGLEIGGVLHVNQASLVTVHVEAQDSFTGRDESYVFHTKVDPNRVQLALTSSFHVPQHPDGSTELTDQEWLAVEPLLRSVRTGDKKVLHSQKSLLEAILLKISTGRSWSAIARGDLKQTNLVSAFRRWSVSGKLERVLSYLEDARNGHRLIVDTRLSADEIFRTEL